MTMPKIEYVASREGGFVVITFDPQEHDDMEQFLNGLSEEYMDIYDSRAWIQVESKAGFRRIQKYFMNYFDRKVNMEVL